MDYAVYRTMGNTFLIQLLRSKLPRINPVASKTIPVIVCFLFISLLGAEAQVPDWTQYPDTKARLAAMTQYGRSCLAKQKFDDGANIFRDAALIAQKSSLDSFTIRNLLYLGIAYRYQARYDSSFFYLRKALQIVDRNNYFSLRAAVNLELFVLYNILGTKDSASVKIKYLESMIPGLDSAGSERAKIELYLGHGARRSLKYTEALQHYQKALDIFVYLKDSTNIAACYGAIGNIFDAREQQAKALIYFRESAKILNQLGRRYELTVVFLNMTDNYRYLNMLDSAEITCRQALSLAIEFKEKNYQSFAYMHLGHIYRLRKQFAKAEDFLQHSIRLGEEINSENAQIDAYQGLAETYMSEQQPAKAKVYIEKHLALAKKINNIEEIVEAYADLKENEYNLHNYAKAHEYEKLYSDYRDSSYNETVSRNMAEMESKYQSEKKEQEIVLLKKEQQLKNTELQKERTIKLSAFILSGLLLIIGLLVVNRYRVIQKAKRMVEIEKLRNNIARDLHDDIGSALSSININSKMALSHASEQKLVKGQLEKIKEHSGKMMEGMSDIIWAINPVNDSLEKMIIRMKEFAVEMLEPLNINFAFNNKIDIAATTLDVGRRKEVYLIFKEAINNAAKYSSCKNIIIDLDRNANQIHLKISDDGKGFDKSLIRSGNGLRNMEQRAVAIGAIFNIYSVIGEGTTVSLDIPIA